jgi:hypothetical protein
MNQHSISKLVFVIGALFSAHASSAVISATASNVALCGGVSIGTTSLASSGTSATNANCAVRIVNEAQSTSLVSNLINDPINLIPGSGMLTSLASTVAAGTLVDSFLIDYQPNALLQGVQGSVTFSQKILAVVYSQAGFGATSYLENGSTAYSYGNNYGIEPVLGDQLSFTGNTLNFRFLASGLLGGDHLRVITEVPVPATLVLLGLGGVAMAARRKKKAATPSQNETALA